MVAHRLQSCWFQTWCFSVGWFPEGFWLFVEFVHAAQEIETRGSHCFFTTMAGSNRWTKCIGSTAQASTGPIHVPEDCLQTAVCMVWGQRVCQALSRESYSYYQTTFRHATHLPTSDGNGFGFMVSILGETSRVWSFSRLASRVYSTFELLAYWGRRGWIQKEMWFILCWHGKQGSKSRYFGTSKALSGKLRHCKKRYLFNASGTMNLGYAFAELDWQNPIGFECHHQTLQLCY